MFLTERSAMNRQLHNRVSIHAPMWRAKGVSCGAHAFNISDKNQEIREHIKACPEDNDPPCFLPVPCGAL